VALPFSILLEGKGTIPREEAGSFQRLRLASAVLVHGNNL
jgi:hypothetical protein